MAHFSIVSKATIEVLAAPNRQYAPVYRTKFGRMIVGKAEEVLATYPVTKSRGKVQLILTSPPFPLNRKKKYGNLKGDEYVEWLSGLAPLFREYLRPDGSLVVELGNAWVPGKPIMSTLTLKALIGFLEAADLNLCQEFICFNPARLPSPAQWVNVERIRVKDAFTRVWWMSPAERPKADNRDVLTAYSDSMRKLLLKGTYNPGRRPSGHKIGETSFLKENDGSIPPNVLVPSVQNMLPELLEVLPIANTGTTDAYQAFCRAHGIEPHPARMPLSLAEFFIRFLTGEGDLVMDPFAGSNTTGFVAESLRRRWLSIEAESKYAAASGARFIAGTNGRTQLSNVEADLAQLAFGIDEGSCPPATDADGPAQPD